MNHAFPRVPTDACSRPLPPFPKKSSSSVRSLAESALCSISRTSKSSREPRKTRSITSPSSFLRDLLIRLRRAGTRTAAPGSSGRETPCRPGCEPAWPPSCTPGPAPPRPARRASSATVDSPRFQNACITSSSRSVSSFAAGRAMNSPLSWMCENEIWFFSSGFIVVPQAWQSREK